MHMETLFGDLELLSSQGGGEWVLRPSRMALGLLANVPLWAMTSLMAPRAAIGVLEGL